MRNLTIGVALLALAGCSQPLPDSGVQQGVGFGSYDQYLAEQQARDEALQTLNEQTVRPPQEVEISSAELTGAEAVAVLESTSTGAAIPAPQLNNPEISDEQDFEAVSNRPSSVLMATPRSISAFTCTSISTMERPRRSSS